MSSERFYAELPVLDDFLEITDPENYTPLPDDWLVVVSDVEGSTAAVQRGRYRDVNLMGASSIMAVLNAVRPVEVPYVFGGDGASMCIPPELFARTRDALLATQRVAREEFGLTLRAGIVPVKVIHEAGYAINVAKCRHSEHSVQAAFAGGGLMHVESLLKDDHAGRPYRLSATDAKPVAGDFSGLECRWDSIPSVHGEIVTLMVQATDADPRAAARTYRDVMNAISAVYGAAEVSRPVAPAQMRLTLDSEKLRGEALVRMAGRPQLIKILYVLLMKFQLVFGKLFIDRGWHVAGIDWRKYKQDVIANTDYRKFDDVLRHVLSGNAQQRERLSEFLEQRYQRGELVYGMHTAPTALMTCLIFQRDGGHVHFVDGADGGYTMAADDLKRRLYCRLS